MFKKLREKLKRNKKETPPTWGEKEETLQKNVVEPKRLREARKIRVPRIRGFKRVLATILFLFNLIIGFTSLFSIGAEPLALVFLPTAFILLDYLWMRRRARDILWEQ